MSRHWNPQRPSEWTVIDGYEPGDRSRSGVVPIVVSAVLIGLLVGGALSWTARHAEPGPSGAIEWNAVQAVPTRVPDAADVAWEKRAGAPDAASGGITVSGQHIYVIDGDTFDLNGTRIRVAGIDAPETHPANCAEEARLGIAATRKLAELLRGRPLWISGLKTDRYGRSVGTVRAAGQDVADAMIGAGLARNYDGKQRQSWC
ncbi:MAG: thermonuclease family protein [Sphingomicrobium sp.]